MSRPWFVSLVVALGLLVGLLPAGPISAQESGGDPALGQPAVFIGPEGVEVARITVEEIVDPFRDYASYSAPQRGYHYVLLRVAVVNEDDRPLTFDPATIAVQDRDGFLAYATSISRTEESTATDPDLAYGDIEAGAEARGVVAMPVINGADLIRVVFTPARDRLVVLADLREPSGAQATAAPAAEAPTAAAIEEPAPTEEAAAPPPALATYLNAEFGFQLTYDPALWTTQSSDPISLVLTDGQSVAQIAGSATLPTNAIECVADQVASLSTTAPRQNYAPMRDASGAALAGGDAQAAFATFTFAGGRGDVFEQVMCLTLPGDRGVVTVIHNGPLDAFAAESAKLSQLLSGLDLG
ncbi:MAG: DUF4352 domain-containing protein [Thermomicrobiales bacterium]|nr:DUF4352 domain-containing protein [Thermomicrobiales bacterium]